MNRTHLGFLPKIQSSWLQITDMDRITDMDSQL